MVGRYVRYEGLDLLFSSFSTFKKNASFKGYGVICLPSPSRTVFQRPLFRLFPTEKGSKVVKKKTGR